jgi:hypothetical protein
MEKITKVEKTQDNKTMIRTLFNGGTYGHGLCKNMNIIKVTRVGKQLILNST